MLYGFSMLPIVYVMSFIFKEESVAFAWLTVISILTGRPKELHQISLSIRAVVNRAISVISGIAYIASKLFTLNAVLPNLCAAAHECAARAVEVCRGRMSEIKSFRWEVSLQFSTVIENVQFAKFSHGTLLPLHHII